MSLMPEYGRQLRAGARLAGGPVAPVTPSRGGLGSRLFIRVTAAVAVAVTVTALILIGHRGSPGASTPGAAVRALPALQYDCPRHEILRTKGPLVATAHGAVGGQHWTLEVDSDRRGLGSVQAGRLRLGGRAYGFCETGLDVELVNAGPYGILYGLATSPYRPPIVIEATTAHGTAAHPVRADRYPARTRSVPGATLFLRALPASACQYRGLAVVAAQRAARPRRRPSPLCRTRRRRSPGGSRRTARR